MTTTLSSVYITTEVRMHVDTSGRVRALHNAAHYEKWAPFREAFGRVVVVGRVDHQSRSDNGGLVEGPGVVVKRLPQYEGLKGLIRSSFGIWRTLSRAADGRSIIIGRLPEPISLLAYLAARRVGAIYVAMVVSEPRQLVRSIAPNVLGEIMGWAFAGAVRSCVRRSAAVVYVTREWLQSHYPAASGAPTLARSNVVLSDSSFVASPRSSHPDTGEKIRLVSIGTMGSAAKGFDDLCRVLQILREKTVDVSLDIVGGGAFTSEVEKFAATVGVADVIRFHGHISDVERVQAILDSGRLYVSMSRVEGLPRAVIEAMARGLPVLSTRAGGTSELVDEQCLVHIGDYHAMAELVMQVANDPELLNALSKRNLATARTVAALAAGDRLTEFLVGIANDRRTRR